MLMQWRDEKLRHKYLERMESFSRRLDELEYSQRLLLNLTRVDDTKSGWHHFTENIHDMVQRLDGEDSRVLKTLLACGLISLILVTILSPCFVKRYCNLLSTILCWPWRHGYSQTRQQERVV